MLTFSETQVVAMSDHAGAAKWRRERRLRHERMTVAMELAAALHQSCGVKADATNNAPRGQETASSAGARPGVLEDLSWVSLASKVTTP